MFTYNDNGNYIAGSKKHTSEWEPIVKDENGVITSPAGLVTQVCGKSTHVRNKNDACKLGSYSYITSNCYSCTYQS
jgi:hypothetical protein